VFLNKARAGADSHVREGTILEEQASMAHGVGLKQTILFPFAAVGSLVNFCDCLLAGGTGPKDHSEVGSGFIHFNYSPNQDKATASLFGDVPRGVMLREKPVFLGGQGGAVGPLQLTFGTVTAAGTICRKDETSPGKLIVEQVLKGGSMSYTSGVYLNIRRIVTNNINYIANLIALMRWYEYVRSMFTDPVDFPEALVAGAKDKIEMGILERIRQVELLCENMPRSIAIYKNKKGEGALASLVYQKEELYEKKDVLAELLNYLLKTEVGDESIRDDFLRSIEPVLYDHDKDYIKVLQEVDYRDAMNGTVWLRSVVDNVMDRVGNVLPSFELMGVAGESTE
jgi:UDP-N-acetylglucosamine/UDP-N-acetylgalactosamine diphosphorylase